MSDYNGKSYEFDDIIEHDSNFTLLPDGEYKFLITGVERARYGGSTKLPPCNMVTVSFHVFNNDQSGADAELTYRFFLHSKCEWQICAFYVAIGLRKPGEKLKMIWDDSLKGKMGRCRIGLDEYTGRNGDARQKNEITAFLPPDASSLPPGNPPMQRTPYMPGAF